MCVAILGYGAVAAVHVHGLSDLSRDREGAVFAASTPGAIFGPNEEKARRFATTHGIAVATDSIERALEGAQAAIVCSPTPRHSEQARAALEAGAHVLVELPPCESLSDALALRDLARVRNRVLQCAHTSRYLDPFRRLGEWIRAGELGEIQQVRYWRAILPRTRSWIDDALLHHAAHPLDLLLHWFGTVRPLACAAHPHARGAQNAALVAELPNGAPASIGISYTARLADVRMTVVGSVHTVETDGFSFVRSDHPEWCWEGDGDRAYAQAVADQDRVFLAACARAAGGVVWDETIALMAMVEQFRRLRELSSAQSRS